MPNRGRAPEGGWGPEKAHPPGGRESGKRLLGGGRLGAQEKGGGRGCDGFEAFDPQGEAAVEEASRLYLAGKRAPFEMAIGQAMASIGG